MSCVTVKNQAELDAALSDESECVHIESDRGVWLTINSSGSATVRASGSATVRASGSASVEAYGLASVEAGSHVAVHRHSVRAQITGGVVIDHTAVGLNYARTWCAYHGVDIVQRADLDMAVLYKATDATLTAGLCHGKPTVYPVGAEVTCLDWRDDHNCGGGLHVSPRPYQAASYAEAQPRFLRVLVPVDQLRPIGADKCKTPTLFVQAEVDAFGRDLATATAVTS